MSLTTYYETLQVARDADEAVIRAAYRVRSQKLHPDKNPAGRDRAHHAMQKLNEAYAVLSDPARRAAYDRVIAESEAEAAKSAARTVARNLYPSSSPRPARPGSLEKSDNLQARQMDYPALIVRPKLWAALLFALFGGLMTYAGFDAIGGFLSGTTWAGPGQWGIPNSWYQVIFAFIGVPFGLYSTCIWGMSALMDTLSHFSEEGIRHPSRGMRLTPWSEISSWQLQGKTLYIKSKTGRKLFQFDAWTVHTPLNEIASYMQGLGIYRFK